MGKRSEIIELTSNFKTHKVLTMCCNDKKLAVQEVIKHDFHFIIFTD